LTASTLAATRWWLPRLPVGGGEVQEPERPDTEEREDLVRSVLEGPGMEAPRDEVARKVEEGRRAFMSGKLLFMRNWPYVYNLASKPDPANKVKDKFGVAPPPGFSATGSSSLGGLNLAVSPSPRSRSRRSTSSSSAGPRSR
jgi:ABC-type glycerol-3-phosphate transport system substrate-binding protein